MICPDGQLNRMPFEMLRSVNFWWKKKPFELQKRSQLFLRMHKVTLSVVAMRQRSRLFAPPNQSLIRSPNSNPLLLRLSAMISQYFIRANSAFFSSHREVKNGIASKRRRKQ